MYICQSLPHLHTQQETELGHRMCLQGVTAACSSFRNTHKEEEFMEGNQSGSDHLHQCQTSY